MLQRLPTVDYEWFDQAARDQRRFGLEWCGMVWFGLVWFDQAAGDQRMFGLEWFGLVWFDQAARHPRRLVKQNPMVDNILYRFIPV